MMILETDLPLVFFDDHLNVNVNKVPVIWGCGPPNNCKR